MVDTFKSPERNNIPQEVLRRTSLLKDAKYYLNLSEFKPEAEVNMGHNFSTRFEAFPQPRLQEAAPRVPESAEPAAYAATQTPVPSPESPKAADDAGGIQHAALDTNSIIDTINQIHEQAGQ